MPFKKGATRPANSGRKKGAPNKLTKSFREALLGAFHEMGGQESLLNWGKENQTEFYKITARLIPTEVVGEGGDGPVKVAVHHHYEP